MYSVVVTMKTREQKGFVDKEFKGVFSWKGLVTLPVETEMLGWIILTNTGAQQHS